MTTSSLQTFDVEKRLMYTTFDLWYGFLSSQSFVEIKIQSMAMRWGSWPAELLGYVTVKTPLSIAALMS